MKNKILLLIFVLFCAVSVSAQISVLSFEKDAGALDARINSVTNDNDQTCALIKIVTTEKGFAFETDALGICRTEEDHTAEVWVYVAPGSRWIRLKHPQLGQSERYEYKIPIEAACTYRMKIATGKVTTRVENINRENYVVMHIEPTNVSVMVDEEFVPCNEGELSKIYAVGKHRYEISAAMYHTEKGEFAINPDSTTRLNIQLKPNFGYLTVTSTPEDGAVVIIDGEQKGVTPYKSGKMTSRTYEVQVGKTMFTTQSEEVIIKDGKSINLNFDLKPNFAEPTIRCADSEAEIWINDEKKAVGSWSGRLSAGTYRLEAKKNNHRTAQLSVSLKNGDEQTITIDNPSPIYGRLNVNSKPMGATIYIDGEPKGETPKIINHVLIGKHEIKLQKQDYFSYSETVLIEEDSTKNVFAQLPTGREVVIRTTPYNARVYVDNVYAGASSPNKLLLSVGLHQVKVEYGNRVLTDEILVEDVGQSYWDYDVSANSVNVTDVRTEKENDKIKIHYHLEKMAHVELQYSLDHGRTYVFAKKKNRRGDVGEDVLKGNRTIVLDATKENEVLLNRQPMFKVWTEQHKAATFFTLNAAYAVNPQWSFGFTIGQMKQFGWYVGLMTNFGEYGKYVLQENQVYAIRPNTDSHKSTRNSRLSVVAGAVVRTCSPLSLKLGVGFGYRSCLVWAPSLWYRVPSVSTLGVNAEAGVMFHLKNFLISADVVTLNFKYVEYKLGLGWYFPSKK